MAMHPGEEDSVGGCTRTELMSCARSADGPEALFVVLWAAPLEQRMFKRDEYDDWDEVDRRLKWAASLGSDIRLHGVYGTKAAAKEGAARVWNERYACHLLLLVDGDMFVMSISWS